MTEKEEGKKKAVEEQNPIFAAAAAGDAVALAAALSAAAAANNDDEDSSPAAAASYQDPETGRSALHLAAEADSVECVALLLEAGAPWNATDKRGLCPGDAAVARGCSDAAEALLEAGVRAELVLGAIAESVKNGASAGEEEEEEKNALIKGEEERHYLSQRATFHSAPSTGGGGSSGGGGGGGSGGGGAATLLSDESNRGVMMAWESPLMNAHAHAVAKGAKRDNDGKGGGVVLNIGHGLGLVDAAIQNYSPKRHVICEPHPDVLRRMRETGWLSEEAEKEKGIVVIPKRWQDALRDGDLRKHGNGENDDENEEEGNGRYDGIFYDPFDDGEIDVFLKVIPDLLAKKEHAVASFFNGLCSDNAFFHRVSCEVVRRKLSSWGLDCDFVPLPLPASATSEETWKGVTNRYWQLETYNLPVITWKDDGEGEKEGNKKEEEEEK